MDQINLFKEYKGVFDTEKVDDTEIKTPKPRVFDFSPFALQDAIGAKDIKLMWLEYRRLREVGIEAEEIIHSMVGKVRDMIAISLGASKDDLGIKSDFPFNKSKKDVKNWDLVSLKKFYTSLVFAYHESRLGRMKDDFDSRVGEPLDLRLERIVLSV